MRQLAILATCLLLGLSMSPKLAVEAQALGLNEPFYADFDVLSERLYAAQPGEMRLSCQVPLSDTFKAWVKDSYVVGVEPNLVIGANDSNRFGAYYCVADPAISPSRYPALLFVISEITLDIKVDGSKVTPKSSAPTIAKVVGQRTEFVCNFTNYKNLSILPENVKLNFNGTLTSYRAEQIGPGTFKFVFENPSMSNSGSYFCVHEVTEERQKVRSSSVSINWCEINQFMCDNRCRDRSIICNGVADCADRTDELPSLCSPCEPNEVACKDWKGVRPARNCVLKHWLCDGTDDCKNGYDEESPISKDWCINTCYTKPWLNCPHNSTCCNAEDKCIPRAYECDSENGCETSEDESSCCSLALIDPPIRRLVEQREGSRVTLTCRAVGNERPTINWRCNLGKLRDETRMKESNKVIRRNPDNTYEVEGTLVIENFTKADECLYNCEAVTKCKRQLSPIFEVKVQP